MLSRLLLLSPLLLEAYESDQRDASAPTQPLVSLHDALVGDTPSGRRFDGVGGFACVGGARLLYDYEEPLAAGAAAGTIWAGRTRKLQRLAACAFKRHPIPSPQRFAGFFMGARCVQYAPDSINTVTPMSR